MSETSRNHGTRPGEGPRPEAHQGSTRSFRLGDGPTPQDNPLLSACKLPTGLTDHPRYEVLDLIGAGGMGCVYKAQHRFMDRLVALKVINHCLLDRPEMAARFLQEVRTAARLNHPNIVRAFDADRVGDTYFLVMEYVDGVSLDQVVTERGPLPVAEACDCARQCALGLQHAWQHGMVHRDIKPQNLMRSPDGHVKILDFGLARYVSEVAPVWAIPVPNSEPPAATPPAQAPCSDLPTAPRGYGPPGADWVYTYPGVGTADYMAPEEILDARRADIRADIYGLGCTLYRLLTGEVPFPGGSAEEKLRRHLSAEPRPLAALRPEVPPALAQLVARMMAKDPARRPQAPAEVAQGLVPFAGAAHRRVLVVDDDPTVRAAAALTLEAEGYEVRCAAHGREALERLRQERPDLIVLDMMMPVMDGWELLDKLKREPRWAGIPVVIVSAAESGRARAAALQAADYLQKPVATQDLAARVKRFANAG